MIHISFFSIKVLFHALLSGWVTWRKHYMIWVDSYSMSTITRMEYQRALARNSWDASSESIPIPCGWSPFGGWMRMSIVGMILLEWRRKAIATCPVGIDVYWDVTLDSQRAVQWCTWIEFGCWWWRVFPCSSSQSHFGNRLESWARINWLNLERTNATTLVQMDSS